jgi:hypothetical protein
VVMAFLGRLRTRVLSCLLGESCNHMLRPDSSSKRLPRHTELVPQHRHLDLFTLLSVLPPT